MTCRILTCLAIVLLASKVEAQRHRVRFEADSVLPGKLLRPIDIAGPEQVPAATTRFLSDVHALGYLEASIDSCTQEDHGTTCQVTVGRVYRWARLSGAGIPAEIASEARFREKLHNGRPVTPRRVGRLFEALLQYSENNGHPFASVRLDSLRGTEQGLVATVVLDRGPMIRIDSVVLKGNLRTNMRYLQSHIGIRHGDPYNESLIRGAENRIRDLPFVTQRQRPYVQFTPARTKLYLFLDEKRASSINGILGVQPDPVDGDITLTGDLDLRLRNALKRGEAIELQWRRLQDQTQDLRVRFNLPYAFNTPFGADLNFRLFKRDTTFLELNARAGLEYMLLRGDKLSLFLNSKNSDRLGSNTISLPGLADVNILSYGIGTERERFDQRLNPKRGHAFQFEGSVGRKRTSTAVFDPIGGGADAAPDIRTVQYELVGRAIAHVGIKRRSTVRFMGQGGWMINEDLHSNELYRIGGLRTLRGMDEQSIFASAYAVGTVEYRFLYEENSNFFLFVDQGWWEDASKDTLIHDTPIGFGAGTTFATKAGLFSITYALGQQFGNPILLRGGKVHFGFISLF